MTTTLASRTFDRPPEPPFGYGPVRTGTETYLSRHGLAKRIVAQCDSIVTDDVMRAEWDAVRREWSEWYLEF